MTVKQRLTGGEGVSSALLLPVADAVELVFARSRRDGLPLALAAAAAEAEPPGIEKEFVPTVCGDRRFSSLDALPVLEAVETRCLGAAGKAVGYDGVTGKTRGDALLLLTALIRGDCEAAAEAITAAAAVATTELLPPAVGGE